MKSDELIEVAKLGRAVGLKGFVKLHNLGDFPEQFKKGARFFVDKDMTLEISEFDKNKTLVSFVGVNDRNTASKLTNKILKSTKEATRANCELKKDEFFWFDIIGCKVVENGEILGVVEEIERICAQDYLKVKSDERFVKDGFLKSFLIPYIERYIKDTNIDTREISSSGAIDFLEKSV
ncbi:MAG: ribosome maturation factor RimM [Campylobacteraceae bacterium]|jgi:16S rRNA processing protein RimM|nr:ribosome maturation factor RimM [Campylobacteraceae bacterium]